MTMPAFLSIYDLADWIIRGVSMTAQTLVVGGVTYLLFTLTVLKPGSHDRLALERLSTCMLYWSGLALGFAQLIAGSALTTFLVGSTQADIATAVSVDAVIFAFLSAAVAFALAWAARRSSHPTVGLLLFLTALLVGAHTGVTHAASRAEPSPALLAAETLHLFALGAWLGGVPYFIASLRTLGGAREERFAVARRFSVVSLISVPIMIASGVLMSVPYVGSFERLYQTNYGLVLGANAVLLAILLCMGAVNFLIIRKLRRDDTAAFESVPIIGETEIAVGLIAILCAVALASSPLAADTRAAQPTASEIARRFEFSPPRLAIPTQPPSISLTDANSTDGIATTESFPGETARSELDIAWSETHHHYAALFVILTGLAALVSQYGRMKPLTRHWPVLFLSLAIYLFIVADEDAWPLGQTGFFVSLATPRIAQHKAMIAMVAGFALFEWRAQSREAGSVSSSLVFPAMIAAASAFLLTHYGHTGSKEEVLTEISHIPVALLGVIAATARWLELRLPSSATKSAAAFVWPMALIAAGAFLLLYRETT
jgi:putative copper resistance protein D